MKKDCFGKFAQALNTKITNDDLEMFSFFVFSRYFKIENTKFFLKNQEKPRFLLETFGWDNSKTKETETFIFKYWVSIKKQLFSWKLKKKNRDVSIKAQIELNLAEVFKKNKTLGRLECFSLGIFSRSKNFEINYLFFIWIYCSLIKNKKIQATWKTTTWTRCIV